MTSRGPLVAVPDDATPEVVAAITAAVTALVEAQRAAAVSGPGRLDLWVAASRLAARRTGMPRGPWRMSGRVRRTAGV